MTTDMGAIGKMKVAVVGAGLIGRSWSIVFARAGYRPGGPRGLARSPPAATRGAQASR